MSSLPPSITLPVQTVRQSGRGRSGGVFGVDHHVPALLSDRGFAVTAGVLFITPLLHLYYTAGQYDLADMFKPFNVLESRPRVPGHCNYTMTIQADNVC